METNQQTEEAHWMRQRIRDSFAEISCFLMPHPGKKVTIEENYDGKVADMRPQFKDQLVRLVPLLLSPESLQSAVKVIQGHTVTAEQLCKLFQDYTNFFSNNNVPIVKPTSVVSIAETTSLDRTILWADHKLAAADVRNVKMVAALAEIQFRFLSIMFRGAEGCYIDPDYVSNINDTLKVAILKMFYDERCVGGPELAHKHLVKLEQTMDLQNESLLGSNLELEEMTEAVYGNIVANLKVNLHSMSSDANEATSNLEGIGIALARYDVQNKLQARIESIDPAVRHIIYVGHRLADDESKFHDVIEILCEALEKDSNTAMQQAIAKIEGIGIALAILSSDVLARQDKAQTPRLSQEELDNLYSRVEKRAVRAARVQSRYDTASVLEIASTLTPREKRVLKVKKTLSLVFPFM
uniref:GB1/RHD3-type G domain-containing protein n=1 Tax=Timema genevievae TaxID=629358 RepID=A0A7R9K324_TIMGE|nr:unnamed protein product [Timema genevievae]